MIRTSNGRDVAALLARVRCHANRYSALTICSPFLDQQTIGEIVATASAAGRAQCGLRVITSPGAARMVSDALGEPDVFWPFQLTVRDGLHAKVYAAIGRPSKGLSEVIISSANLTTRGIEVNVELGVHATARSAHGRQLIAETNGFIARIAA